MTAIPIHRQAPDLLRMFVQDRTATQSPEIPGPDGAVLSPRHYGPLVPRDREPSNLPRMAFENCFAAPCLAVPKPNRSVV